MELAAFCFSHGLQQDRVLAKGAVFHCQADPGVVLIDDSAATKVEMPHLRVAHLPMRQAYGQAGSAEGCGGIILPESLQVRLAGPGYGIALLDRAYAEAVHDDDCY